MLQNVTIPLPSGTSDHGTSGLLCTPNRWTDIVIFYLANYAAHAATTRSLPGEYTYQFAIVVITALFFPAAGAYRGILGITSLAIFGKTDLEKAARAGALCMVVRTRSWEPQDGDILNNTILYLPPLATQTQENFDESLPVASTQEDPVTGTDTTKSAQKNTRLVTYDPPWSSGIEVEDDVHDSTSHIHGYCNVPRGYRLSLVPRWATFIEADRAPRPTQTTKLSYNYSLVKIMVSFGQAIYAIFTLYRTGGDQISQFGYAAFGLTVAPYAVVSILNLLGSLLCPEFPVIYMVESSIMEEARRRGDEYKFQGTVGKLDEDTIRTGSNTTLPAAADRIRWVLEPVTVKKDDSGYLTISSETQAELSYTTTASAKTPKTFVEARFNGEGAIIAATEKIIHNRLENQVMVELMVPATRNDPSHQTDFQPIPGVDNKECHPTTTQASKASTDLSGCILLVPFGNPTKRKGITRRIDDYRIRGMAGHSNSKNAFSVEMNNAVNQDRLESAIGGGLSFIFSYLAILVPVLIIGILSRFHKGHSTHAQRIWTMTWLSFGAIGPFYVGIMRNLLDSGEELVGFVIGIFFYAAPAIGGFVVVGQMLRSYGTCINIS